MVGYTSRGLGVSDLPMRFNTRGEVVVITLAPAYDLASAAGGRAARLRTARSARRPS